MYSVPRARYTTYARVDTDVDIEWAHRSVRVVHSACRVLIERRDAEGAQRAQPPRRLPVAVYAAATAPVEDIAGATKEDCSCILQLSARSGLSPRSPRVAPGALVWSRLACWD